MTNFEKIKSMSIEELSKFLDGYNNFEDSPWAKWWNENYCGKCESINIFVPYLNKESECAYCEINENCRFFQDKANVPSLEEIIQMWLESEFV